LGSHCGSHLPLHFRRRFQSNSGEFLICYLHLHVRPGKVLLDSSERLIAQLDVDLSVDNDPPQPAPVLTLLGPDRHDLERALWAKGMGIPSGNGIVGPASQAHRRQRKSEGGCNDVHSGSDPHALTSMKNKLASVKTLTLP